MHLNDQSQEFGEEKYGPNLLLSFILSGKLEESKLLSI